MNGIMKSDFYDAIASYLNIWITDKEFESLWTYIDYQGKGTVDIV